jgi:hypothetical protein
MKKHINFSSINQFRHVIESVKRKCEFVSLDENGDAIYDSTKPKDVLKFKGTIKLHGTNASACFNLKSGFWTQSKESIIDINSDNAGFSFFAEKNKEVFTRLFREINEKNNVDLRENTISIFGEWVGKGIQNKVSISKLDKSFFIFGVKISPFNLETPAYWIDFSYLRSKEDNIFNILDFKTFEIDIDFNKPEDSLEILEKLTKEVEDECPVGKEFGIIGLGEGIVWTSGSFKFKTKGLKHKGTRSEKIVTIDVEKVNSLKDFADYSVSEARFDQAVENVFKDGRLDIKKLGELILWVIKDVNKEELDTMVKNNIEPKNANKYISDKVRSIFFERLNNKFNS